MCCDDDWEIRQPQDFVRGIADTQIAPWLRSEPANSFVSVVQALWGQYISTSFSTLSTLFILGPGKVYATSSVSATLSLFIVTPSSPFEINGDEINTQSLG